MSVLEDWIGDEVVLGDLVLCEIMMGVRDEAQATRVDQLLSEFRCVTMSSPVIARTAARNYRILRSKGITIRKTVDILIATWCIEEQVPLLHRDRDFDPFERHLGLRVLR
jgi:predicted nucleic acid-binding protein